MVFRGRTVLAFVLASILASSVVTLAIFQPSVLTSWGRAAAYTEMKLSPEDIKKIDTAYQLIEQRFLNEVDHEQVLNGAIHGMLGSLSDPYSAYMDKEEAKQFQDSLNSSFQGIGAEVSMIDGRVTIVSPIKGSPAEKAGIHAFDVILSINGEKLDGLTLNQAVMKIRGPKGTQAKLEILRSGSSEAKEIIVIRDDIPQETVYSELLEESIGLIDIRQFSFTTADRFAEELAALEAKGMKGLIIDVRNNPGGILPIVVEMVEPFVPQGKKIFQIETKDGHREATYSKGKGKDYPVAVLTNRGSASASEILAAAFKEAAGGKVIGDKSFGKGTVQVTFEKEMGDGSNIKITVFKWLTPDGNWVHDEGLEPDIYVEQPEFFRVSPINRDADLKQDMAGDDVRNLQVILNAIGFPTDRVDGYYNEGTTAALKAFQGKKGLPQTGAMDDITADRLEEAIIEQIRDPLNDVQLQSAKQYISGEIKK